MYVVLLNPYYLLIIMSYLGIGPVGTRLDGKLLGQLILFNNLLGYLENASIFICIYSGKKVTKLEKLCLLHFIFIYNNNLVKLSEINQFFFLQT